MKNDTRTKQTDTLAIINGDRRRQLRQEQRATLKAFLSTPQNTPQRLSIANRLDEQRRQINTLETERRAARRLAAFPFNLW